MGNNTPILQSCFEKNYLPTQTLAENPKLPRKGPIKPRKNFSITTFETISVNPQVLCTNRTSITEFVVNKSDSIFEGALRTPETTSMIYSVPCSPGRYEKKEMIKRNYKTEGTNLVKQVRSRSLVNIKNVSASAESPLKAEYFRNKGLMAGNGSNLCRSRKLSNNFEPFLTDDELRKRLTFK